MTQPSNFPPPVQVPLELRYEAAPDYQLAPEEWRYESALSDFPHGEDLATGITDRFHMVECHFGAGCVLIATGHWEDFVSNDVYRLNPALLADSG